MAAVDEWVTTVEVAERLGYLTRWYLKQRLAAVGIPHERRTGRRKGVLYWHWPSIQARVAFPVGESTARTRISLS